MSTSRREFLKNCGALIVTFSFADIADPFASAQGPFDTHPSHIDPTKLDSWIAVAGDGTVTAYTGKCDLGQGMFTAQTQLIAEELCVPLKSVRLVQCDTSVCPDQGTTSGSQSSPTNFNDANLALAAATAREALLQMASQKFGVRDGLTVDNGIVSDGNGHRISYGDLIGNRKFNLTLNKSAKRRKQSEWKVLGKSIAGLDRIDLMTGRFQFVHNVRVDGMLHGRVVRPPEVGATLRRIDESSVRNLPGNVKVVAKKNFVGVVADKQFQAIEAARKLKIEWNPGTGLPAQQTFYQGLRKLPSRDALLVDSQDIDQQLARAKTVIRATYSYPFQMHGSVGTSCAVADVRQGEATVWSATQSAYPTRSIVAKILGLDPEKVRVIFTRGSGCYGLNGADAVSFDAATLSQAVGRPVRVQLSREDEMAWENYGAPLVLEQRAGIGADGAITVWDCEGWTANRGNRPGYDKPGNVITGTLLGYEPDMPAPEAASAPKDGLRNRSNYAPSYIAGCVNGKCGGAGTIRSERVLSHTVASPFYTGPLRSPQRIQNTFAHECFMDEISERAGADPVEYRLRHLSDERLAAVVKTAAKAANWQTRHSGSKIQNNQKIHTGRGVACVAYEGDNGYIALIADVEVDPEQGLVRATRFVAAIDAGPVSNPDGLKNQTEGGLLQGLSRTLGEEVTWNDRRITSNDWETYHSQFLSLHQPSIEIVLMSPGDVPATGAGETAITVVPAAIGNAIYDATGIRLRELPFSQERIKSAFSARVNRGEA